MLAPALYCARLWQCWEHEVRAVFYAYEWDYLQIALLKVHELNLLNNRSVVKKQYNLSTCMHIEFAGLVLAFNVMGHLSRVGVL